MVPSDLVSCSCPGFVDYILPVFPQFVLPAAPEIAKRPRWTLPISFAIPFVPQELSVIRPLTLGLRASASRSLYALVIGCLLLTGGCGLFRKAAEPVVTQATFPPNRIARDAVGIELGVAQLELGQQSIFESFWRLLDHQEMPLETRQLLDQNGFRVAIMSSHAPVMLNDLVGPRPIKVDELTPLEKQLHKKDLLRPTPRMITHDRISNREGESHRLTVSQTHPQAGWIVRAGDKQTVGRGEMVNGIFSIITFPQGDGSVRLVFRPEIHHGQTRPRYGVGQSSFAVENGQNVTALEDLQFAVTLRPGESLVMAPTVNLENLGRLFFGPAEPAIDESLVSIEPKSTDPLHRLLLVRIVQTQMDDLFSPKNVGEKLTTVPNL